MHFVANTGKLILSRSAKSFTTIVYNYLHDSLLHSFAKRFSFLQTCQIHQTETYKKYVVVWTNLVFKPSARIEIIQSRLLFQSHSTLQMLTTSLTCTRFDRFNKVNLFSDSSPFTATTIGRG